MNEELRVRLINRIASKVGADPAELDPPLYAVVDPSALEWLVGSTGASTAITVEFTYLGYRVIVDSEGEIDVREAAGGRSATAAGQEPPGA